MYVMYGYDIRGISLELESDFEDKRAIYSRRGTDRIFPSRSHRKNCRIRETTRNYAIRTV